MPERDFIEEVYQVTYTGVFDFDTLYKTMQQWLKRNGYNLKEIDYKEFREAGAQKLQVKWEAKRKATDYLKNVLEIMATIDDLTHVLVKNRKRVKGALQVKIASYLEKDYEETWSRKSWLKFIREAYDRFVQGSEMMRQRGNLQKEAEQLRGEIKAFLNLQRIGK